MVSVTVQTDDPERHSEWNRTAGFVRDGKFKERFVITVQRFSCAGPNSETKCDSIISAAVPMNAQVSL